MNGDQPRGAQPSWTDLEQAFTRLASEDFVARRLRDLRVRAGLSQEQLARKLAEQGVQMPQSSISKIEGPISSGRGKRRDITVDEALALARALDVSFSELLLPDNVLSDLHLSGVLAKGPELRRAFLDAESEYRTAVKTVARAVAADPGWREGLARRLDEARSVLAGSFSDGKLSANVRHGLRDVETRIRYEAEFLEDVMREAKQMGTQR